MRRPAPATIIATIALVLAAAPVGAGCGRLGQARAVRAQRGLGRRLQRLARRRTRATLIVLPQVGQAAGLDPARRRSGPGGPRARPAPTARRLGRLGRSSRPRPLRSRAARADERRHARRSKPGSYAIVAKASLHATRTSARPASPACSRPAATAIRPTPTSRRSSDDPVALVTTHTFAAAGAATLTCAADDDGVVVDRRAHPRAQGRHRRVRLSCRRAGERAVETRERGALGSRPWIPFASASSSRSSSPTSPSSGRSGRSPIEADFDHLWNFDHFAAITGDPERDVLEGWTLLGAMAEATSRVRIGCMVTGNTYRHPAVLAKMAVTIDHLSGGRLELGIGAAWAEIEHEMLGIEFGTAGRRVAWLDEACQVMKLLFTQERTTFDGRALRAARRDREPEAGAEAAPAVLDRRARRAQDAARDRRSTPMSGTRPAASPTRSRAWPASSTPTAPMSAATPPRSAARCRCATAVTTTRCCARRGLRAAQHPRPDRVVSPGEARANAERAADARAAPARARLSRRPQRDRARQYG